MFAVVPLLLVAHAVAQPVRHERVVNVPPEEVLALLTDTRAWADWWGGNPRHAPEKRWVTRGLPGSVGQELRWTAGAAGSGVVQLVAVVPESGIDYRARWLHRPMVSPDPWGEIAHDGRVRVAPAGTGSVVTWEAVPTPTLVRPPGAAGRLDDAVRNRLDRFVAAASLRAPPVALADPPPTRSDALFLWQGYTHRWTYNHRINRHGDWVEPATCEGARCAASAVHAAASGSGIDRARWGQAAALLRVPGVEVWNGHTTLWFDGAEGERLTDHVCVPAPAPFGEVVLQGWDVDSVGPADSLWELQAGVVAVDGQVCVDASVRMACFTPECGAERRTAYSIGVWWALLSGPITATVHSVRQDQTWEADDIGDEVVPEEWTRRVALAGQDGGDVVTVGIRRLSIALARPHHTLGIDARVRPGPWDPVHRTLPADVDLLFVPWGPVEIAPLTVAQFAEPGHASLGLDLVLIQAPRGCVQPVTRAGAAIWPGGNADGSGDGAETRSTLEGACGTVPEPTGATPGAGRSDPGR